MRRAFVFSLTGLALLLLIAGCRSGRADLTRAETQRQFGVRMAKISLWREAMFRFQRAAEISPDDAMARNNLAVALEANGDSEGAAREYREALRLDRSNQHIQKNYSRYVEFTQRAKKRDAPRAPTTTAAPAPSDAVSVPATTTAVPVEAEPPAPMPPATATTPPPGGAR